MPFSLLPVPGEWGEWSDFTCCSKTCDGGESTSTRRCNDQQAVNKGCLRSDGSGEKVDIETRSKACNTEPCKGKKPGV